MIHTLARIAMLAMVLITANGDLIAGAVMP